MEARPRARAGDEVVSMTSSADRPHCWDPDAVPGTAPPPAVVSEQILVVDGERFRVSEHRRQDRYHCYSYDWLTGPNPGYGFGSSAPQQSNEDHTTAIRYFLADFDPDTGYLSEP